MSFFMNLFNRIGKRAIRGDLERMERFVTQLDENEINIFKLAMQDIRGFFLSNSNGAIDLEDFKKLKNNYEIVSSLSVMYLDKSINNTIASSAGIWQRLIEGANFEDLYYMRRTICSKFDIPFDE